MGLVLSGNGPSIHREAIVISNHGLPRTEVHARYTVFTNGCSHWTCRFPAVSRVASGRVDGFRNSVREEEQRGLDLESREQSPMSFVVPQRVWTFSVSCCGCPCAGSSKIYKKRGHYSTSFQSVHPFASLSCSDPDLGICSPKGKQKGSRQIEYESCASTSQSYLHRSWRCQASCMVSVSTNLARLRQYDGEYQEYRSIRWCIQRWYSQSL